MLGRHHILIGCAGTVAALSVGAAAVQAPGITEPTNGVDYWTNIAVLLAAATAGSLAPDIDHSRSLATNFCPVARWTLGIFSRILSHRGVTHSFLAWWLVSLAVSHLLESTALAFCSSAFSLGYLLHLAADALTTRGVPLFWPLYSRPLGFPPRGRWRFATGSRREYLMVGLVLGLTLMLLISHPL